MNAVSKSKKTSSLESLKSYWTVAAAVAIVVGNVDDLVVYADDADDADGDDDESDTCNTNNGDSDGVTDNENNNSEWSLR